MWVFAVERPALVLGSTQRDEIVDHTAAERAGIDVVRRRSGGGAVLLVPGETLWIDIVLPRGDSLWDDDVGRASHWLGSAWARALADAGIADPAVHEGALVCGPWCKLVCFGGLGPGEVTAGAGGPKLVGISQRRSRAGARFQCTVMRRWDPVGILDLLALTPEDRRSAVGGLTGAAMGVGDAMDALANGLIVHLPE